MRYEAHKEERDGLILTIYPEEESFNPRTYYDNFGKMVCFHRNYNLGDKHDYKDPSEARYLIDQIESEDGIVLPLYLYEHLGITISTSPFSCPWDSGQVGWIYATKQDIDKGFSGDKERATKCLIVEVETYDQFITGDVWYVEIEDENREHIDSCGGFFGLDYAIEEGRRMLENALEGQNA